MRRVWHGRRARAQAQRVCQNLEGRCGSGPNFIPVREHGRHREGCGAFSSDSPQAKKGYKVDVEGGMIDQTLEVSSSFTDAVDEDFIDSTQAMAEAKKKGLKGKNKAMMTLHIMLKGNKSQGAYWNIVSDRPEGRSTLINAKTGKFFRHQALK